MKKNVLQIIKVIVLGLILSLGVSYAFAQPSNNVPGPLNVGTSTQIKNGDLSVNGFLATLNSAFLGKVGIGISIPKDTLHVAGNIVQSIGGFLMSNIYSSGGLKYIGNGYGSIIRLNNGSGNLEFAIAPNNTSGAGAAASPMTKAVITSTGKVGIGMVAPQATLDVLGDVKATGAVVGTLKVTGGTPSVGKVLTSDAVGVASWGAIRQFGGTYTRWTVSPYTCLDSNPLAGNTCSCPSGFTEYQMATYTYINGQQAVMVDGHSGAIITGSVNLTMKGCYK